MKNELIKYAPLFVGLSDGEREDLAAGFAEGQCATGASLLKAGERAEAVYLIGQGFVSLSTPSGQNIATLGPGSLMGEASLFRASSLELNAVALSDLQFWKLTDRGLRELILQRPAIGIRLSRNFGSLLVQMEDYLLQRLSATSEMGSLPQHTLQAVAKRLQPVEVNSGATIFRAGEMPAGLYLVESGGLDLRVEGRANPAPRTVEPGRLIGTASLLTAKPTLETAVAARDSLLWLFPVEAFQAISAQHPGLRRSLARGARANLNRTDQGIAVTRLAQMPMFAEAPPPALQAVAERMVLQPVPAGERVYTVGELGDALYLVESGEVELTAENATGVVEGLARVDQGGMFGEMSLLMGRSRAEDATATRNTNLWILYKSDLDELATQHPALGKAMSQGLATKLATEEQGQDADRFRAFELFTDLGAAELTQVSEYLRPTRYRAGEQIYRSTSPADTLFLLEKGHVRVQPLSGGSWVLGPGETFGERALLTNQPHNAGATAETDVDVWTLAKSDFDMLMNRYPTLAISMSRMLSQRLSQAQTGMADGLGGPVYVPMDASTNLPSRRRSQAVAYPGAPLPPPAPRRGPGFVEWFTGLSRGKKIAVAVVVLLLIWLIGIAAPAALLSMIRGSTSVASGADLATHSRLFNALNAAYSMGSYELAAEDKELADALALADKQVPPTPMFTPPPTETPIPTPTFTPTPIPTATSLPTATPTLRPFVQEVLPPTDTPTAEPQVQVAAVSRAWDPRLDKLGVVVEDAPAAPGQQYWRLIEGRWADEQEAGGKHHIYVELLDENGNRVVGNPVTVYWGDGSYTNPTEDKAPPDFGWNYQMYAAGNAYNVKVEGMPSDIVHGAGMGDIERPKYGIHTAFYFTYKKSTK